MSIAPPPALPTVFGLLDVGTFKIVCLVMVRTGDNYRLAGFGHQRSRGLKASVVVDADAAEDAVRAAIAQAEHMAGVTVEDVVISAACGRLMSTHLAAGLDLDGSDAAGRTVEPADIDRLLAAGRAHAERDDRAALGINALSARLDGIPLPALGVGVFGRRLSLDVHTVSVDRAPLRHLIHVAERCQLRVTAVAPAPLAAALAVTTAEECRDGIAVVDFGAGSTGLAVFTNGNLVCAHVFPIGGNHLTFDLMRALNTTVTEAERIKKNYAIQSPAHSTADEVVLYQPREEEIDGVETLVREEVGNRSLVVFDSGDEVVVQAGEKGVRFLLVSGKPLREPVAWHGPIVMNTQAEIRQAMTDLRNGTFIS